MLLQAQIFLDKDKLKDMRPLHIFIMRELLKMGISGATSFTGHSGFGQNQVLKQPARHFSFDETPMVITFIDEEEKVKAAISEIRKHYSGGMIVTHSVNQW